MNCDQAREQLLDLIYDELGGERRAAGDPRLARWRSLRCALPVAPLSSP